MGKTDGRDTVEIATRPTPAADRVGAPKSGLPTGEPVVSPSQHRQSLVQSIDELEGALRFMGTSHPKRASMEQRLQELRRLLEQLDRAGPA